MSTIVFFRRFLSLFFSFFVFFSGLFSGTVTPVNRRSDTADVVNDISGDSSLSESVLLASRLANLPQAVYANAKRSAYRASNANASLTHTLGKYHNGATLTDPEGGVYIADSFDAWCADQRGDVYYSAESFNAGRVNTIRLGEYYYDVHVRDYDLKPGAFKVDKNFHVWADRLYLQYTLFADEQTRDLNAFGAVIRIPAQTVAAMQIEDAAGLHKDTNVDCDSVTYAAFDIKGVGVTGFILPVTGETKSLCVTKENGEYVITMTADYEPGAGINKHDETGDYALNNVTMGCRIYTDKTHDFNGVAATARIERTPLAITCDDGSPAVWEGLRGCYTVILPGTHFQYAYDHPDTRFTAALTIPGTDDRDIYIRAFTGAGGLEAGAVLDENDMLAPIAVQVSKNFCGDVVEHYYSERDYAYGDAYFPIAVKSGKDLTVKAVHLYQNWGNTPLKQLSSIEFGTSYYHLSTGTTESNCIAIYYCDEKGSGYLLPDFRGRSGRMWSGQPQFNAVGFPYFMYDRSLTGIKTAEYAGSNILSAGPTHSDIEMRFISADGSYQYILRHVEFPQTDENRTYYTVEVEFLKNKTYLNFKNEVDLFAQNSRWFRNKSIGYVDEQNREVLVPVSERLGSKFYRLGDNCPYFSLVTAKEDLSDSTFGGNAATVVRNWEVIRNGTSERMPLTIRDGSTKDTSLAALTLDAGPISFKKGDSIRLDLILIPWGDGTETNCSNIAKVREDSALNRLTATAETGTVAPDTVIPTVQCENNEAVFTVTGGGNYSVVKLTGFTAFGRLRLEEQVGGEWQPVELSSIHGYDGYGVSYNADGTYCYSFVYEADGTARTFRATVG